MTRVMLATGELTSREPSNNASVDPKAKRASDEPLLHSFCLCVSKRCRIQKRLRGQGVSRRTQSS